MQVAGSGSSFLRWPKRLRPVEIVVWRAMNLQHQHAQNCQSCLSFLSIPSEVLFADSLAMNLPAANDGLIEMQDSGFLTTYCYFAQ